MTRRAEHRCPRAEHGVKFNDDDQNAGRARKMKMATDKLEKLILKLLSDEFDVLHIVSVDVKEDTDADDQRMLRVDVVFEGERKKVDPRKLAGLVRKIRPALLNEDETAFPVFSFIAHNEMSRAQREAADKADVSR